MSGYLYQSVPGTETDSAQKENPECVGITCKKRSEQKEGHPGQVADKSPDRCTFKANFFKKRANGEQRDGHPPECRTANITDLGVGQNEFCFKLTQYVTHQHKRKAGRNQGKTDPPHALFAINYGL